MPSFGKKSLKILDQLHPDLKLLCMEAIERVDFSLICGIRNKEEQEEAWLKGKSQAHYGKSAHNFTPSRAFDFTPYPCDWDDIKDFKRVAEIIIECALELKIDITWGGNFKKQEGDYGHFELTNWRKINEN